MSGKLTGYAQMRSNDELQWLRDHGVQIDPKGRIIVSLPAADEYQAPDEGLEASISELMRHDVRVRGGSHGRRRRRPPKPASYGKKAEKAEAFSPSRAGRPAIGSEVRVYVQTSIAQTTREILSRRGLTLADVFNDCARELADGP